MVASGKPGFEAERLRLERLRRPQPRQIQSGRVLVTEVLITFFFLFVIIGCTSKGAAVGFAGIPIGLA